MFTIPRPALVTPSRERVWQAGWIYERDLHGHRCLAVRDAAGTRLYSRTGRETTAVFPEIVEALQQAAGGSFVLDGEVVAFEGSQTSFAKLEPRMGRLQTERAAASRVPAYFYVFDVLELGDENVRSEPLLERKRRLRGLLRWEDPVRWTQNCAEVGEDWFLDVCHRGWEGVVAKRGDAPYVPGRHRDDWLGFTCPPGDALAGTATHRASSATQCEPGPQPNETARSSPVDASTGTDRGTWVAHPILHRGERGPASCSDKAGAG